MRFDGGYFLAPDSSCTFVKPPPSLPGLHGWGRSLASGAGNRETALNLQEQVLRNPKALWGGFEPPRDGAVMVVNSLGHSEMKLFFDKSIIGKNILFFKVFVGADSLPRGLTPSPSLSLSPSPPFPSRVMLLRKVKKLSDVRIRANFFGCQVFWYCGGMIGVGGAQAFLREILGRGI